MFQVVVSGHITISSFINNDSHIIITLSSQGYISLLKLNTYMDFVQSRTAGWYNFSVRFCQFGSMYFLTHWSLSQFVAMDDALDNSSDWCANGSSNWEYRCAAYQFVHGAAALALTLSILASLLNIYSIVWARRKSDGPVRSRKLVERIILYMALSDFGYAACHISNHIHLLLPGDQPTYNECVLYGATVTVLACAEACLVGMMSLNALLLTVYRRVLTLGPYDCGLFVFLIVGSTVVLVTVIEHDGFGQDVAW